MFEGDFMKNFILVRLDYNYCDYLRQFDDKVPYNKNKKELERKYPNFVMDNIKIEDIMLMYVKGEK